MRYAVIKATATLLVEMCKNDKIHVRVTRNKLPDDTRFVRAGYDNTGLLYLVIESSEFEDLKENALIPELPSPEFEKV